MKFLYAFKERAPISIKLGPNYITTGFDRLCVSRLASRRSFCGRNHAALPRFLTAVFFDIGLKSSEEVVTAGGSTQAAIRIPLTRFAQLTGATWVDVCKEM